MTKTELLKGNCLDVLRDMPDASVDSIVTDPPYGLSAPPDITRVLTSWTSGMTYEHGGGGFMGKEWDAFVPGPDVWAECFRVLKPGGHLLAFAGTRTSDLMGISLRIGGFEIRDTMQWLYGTGFPKSMNVGKAIDKAAGAERTEGAREWSGGQRRSGIMGDNMGTQTLTKYDTPATPEAEQWDGWGTALKPAYEPIIVCRKPLEGTVANNVLAHGTGAINIDASRVGYTSSEDQTSATPQGKVTGKSGALAGAAEDDEFVIIGQDGLFWSNDDGWVGARGDATRYKNTEDVRDPLGAVGREPWRKRAEFQRPDQKGRFPANVILSHHPECVEVGMKAVKGSNTKPSDVGRGKDEAYTNGIYGDKVGKVTVSHTNEDGTETVEDWKCVADCPVSILDKQSGTSKSSGGRTANISTTSTIYGGGSGLGQDLDAEAVKGDPGFGDIGGASRFFYCAKASKSERNTGLPEGMKNVHPTVKPVALMEYLVRLVTPPGGTVLDPYCGSGTTLVAATQLGFDSIGIDRDDDDTYLPVAEARIIESGCRMGGGRRRIHRKEDLMTEPLSLPDGWLIYQLKDAPPGEITDFLEDCFIDPLNTAFSDRADPGWEEECSPSTVVVWRPTPPKMLMIELPEDIVERWVVGNQRQFDHEDIDNAFMKALRVQRPK